MVSLFPLPAPLLPQFSSLLFKGPYHASAPIHLAISHTAQSPESSVIVLSASSFANDLHDLNDSWIATHSGHGSVVESSSRVQLYYPPSPAHMSLLLSTFHLPEASSPDFSTLHPKITLHTAPTLIILHEPSAYFLKQQSQPNGTSHSWTTSSYISLITRAMSLAGYLGGSSSQAAPNPISLAVFDSRLDQLKLPVIQRPTYGGHACQGDAPRLEAVSILVQNYFEWIGVFDLDPAKEDTGVQAEVERGHDRYMRVCLNKANSHGKEQHLWQWLERTQQTTSRREKRCTEFIWEGAPG